MKKVFCKDCIRFGWIDEYLNADPDHWCWRRKERNAYGGKLSTELCEDINDKNKCKSYKKRKWWQINI